MDDANSALFPWVNCRPMTFSEVNKLVQALARVAGYEDSNDYSGHSFSERCRNGVRKSTCKRTHNTQTRELAWTYGSRAIHP